ncbi:ABC transporter substrate-binding protein [Bradyrhizobium glycinis]|uniref:ABC transporter substrate-binding protein n=1 Tax=Bradyrhizobium glycinis TaxID=2751812 RepID=UPI0018D7F63D|nr:ABC transporter substrate-binding protein [Bradyrhizobium glycinis]MBH5373493.1 ABC transporter substrate-binding protein [Bradyrhizobium glycinis]
MTISRRQLIRRGMAAGAAVCGSPILRAQSAPSDARTVRMAGGNISNFDPYTTTSYTTVDHGLAIYDTLFALDSNLAPQPQMVGKWGISDDKTTYTFELRDGLGFHDGSPVTAADCVASIRRWFETSGGQLVKARAKDVSKKDDKTFTITLREPLELLVDQMAESVDYLLFVMREKDADRPPTEAVKTHFGSGPYKFNQDLFRPGARIVYDPNEKYVPRKEPPSGLAGGKIVRIDRVIKEAISEQTAVSALEAGEIDFVALPPANLLPVIESNSNLVLEDLHKSGDDYLLRMNWLHKPFDNVKARQAVLHLIDQEAFLRVINPDSRYNRPIISLFGANTPYTRDTSTGWYKKGGDSEKAKQLFREAGYSGEKVVILQPTDWLPGSNLAQLLAATLSKIGINAELAPSSWAGLSARRSKKNAVEDGGWNIYITSVSDLSCGYPLSSAWMSMNGEYYGWPKNDEYETLRAQWANVTFEERKTLASKMQQIWWDTASSVFLGQSIQPIARRKTLTGLISFPALLPLWNMQKS